MLKKGEFHKCLAYVVIEAYVVLDTNIASLVTKDAISPSVVENILTTYLKRKCKRDDLRIKKSNNKFLNHKSNIFLSC